MAKKNRRTPMQELWHKEITRIKRLIRRMESRGYRVDYVLPERPDMITKKTIADLRSETTSAKMTSRSTYVNKDGEIISGYQAQTEVRKRGARKAQLTKQFKKQRTKREEYRKWLEEKQREKREQRQRDIESPYNERREFEKYQKKRRDEGKDTDSIAYQSSTILHRLRSELDKWSRLYIDQRLLKNRPDFVNAMLSKKSNANGLLALLDECIAKEGERRIVLRLETKATEINEALSDFNRSSTSSNVESATVRLATYIKGSSLTQEESEYFTSEFEDFEDFDFPDIER